MCPELPPRLHAFLTGPFYFDFISASDRSQENA